jgi:spoIIIJ-associated protein
MDNRTNLDDYLAELGISEADESVTPPPAPEVAGFAPPLEAPDTELAERLAIGVAKSGEAHELQPMPAAERRVIHIALKEHPDVMSESVGEGASRRLVIKPRHS